MSKKNSLTHLFLNNRAITPVLSSLLLTIIAVSAMAIAASATYVITTNMRETMSERIIIEDVWFNPIENMICVFLRNTGKVEVHLSASYINHTLRFVSMPFNLEIDGSRWLNFSGWTSGDLYLLEVVTTRGTHVGGYFEAP